jgi:oligopeptidase A
MCTRSTTSPPGAMPTTHAARGLAFLRRSRAEPRALREVQGNRRERRIRPPVTRPARIIDHELRDFRLSGAELPEERSRASRRSRRNSRSSRPVLGEPARRHQRLCRMGERRSRTCRLPDDARQAAREAAAERTARAAGSSRCTCPPTCRSCNTPTAAACARAVPRLRHPRRRIRLPEWTTAADRRILELRRGRSATARLRTTTPKCRWCRRWPNRRPQVLGFLRDMANKAKPFAERDVAELRDFAARRTRHGQLESWDLSWASEKLKQAALQPSPTRK